MGALAILIRYVVARRLPVWSPVLVLLGFGAVGVSLDLLAVGALLVAAGLAPLAVASRSRGAVPTR